MRLFCAEHLVKASQRRSLNLGASQSRTLNESKPKAQHEFSERDKQRQRENTMFDFQEELKKLPHSPGVYIMHDAQDEIIYVGKAIDLHNRVRSYFRKIVGRSPQIGLMGVFMIIRFPETDLGRGNNSDSALRRHCSRQSGKADADAHPSLYHRNPGRQFPDC